MPDRAMCVYLSRTLSVSDIYSITYTIGMEENGTRIQSEVGGMFLEVVRWQHLVPSLC